MIGNIRHADSVSEDIWIIIFIILGTLNFVAVDVKVYRIKRYFSEMVSGDTPNLSYIYHSIRKQCIDFIKVLWF
mgnify:CR=1 FL=1